QVGQKDDRPIRKLKRIVMRSHQITVDLAEYRRLRVGFLDLRARRAQRCKGNLLRERQLRSWKNADRRCWVLGCDKAPCAGPEVSRRQLVADLCGARPHMLQAVVAHVEELLCRPPTPQLSQAKMVPVCSSPSDQDGSRVDLISSACNRGLLNGEDKMPS